MGIFEGAGIGALVGAGIGEIVGIVKDIVETINGADSFWDYLDLIIVPIIRGLWEALIGAGIGLVLGIIIGLIIVLFTKKYSKKESIKEAESNKKDNKRAMALYKEELNRYNKATAQDRYRVQKENIERTILTEEWYAIDERKKQARRRLDLFYRQSGIDESYCQPIPIAYMHEFIKLGIATHLQGADGLYYLIRNELRADYFQASLNDMNQKLDVIISNQERFYREITRELNSLNKKCDKMIEESQRRTREMIRSHQELLNTVDHAVDQNNRYMKQVVENSSITAYNTSRCLAEEKYQSFMLTVGLLQ